MDLSKLEIPKANASDYEIACYVDGGWFFVEKLPEKYTGAFVTYVTGVWYEKVLYLNGELHAIEGAASITADGYACYYKHGQLHRVGAPAVIRDHNNYSYFFYGSLHRTDGPSMAWNGQLHYSMLCNTFITKNSTIIIVK